MKLSPVVNAVGVGGLLSAFGYTALRAHWNFLGVTAPAGGVPAERYISETWSVIAGSVLLILLASLVLLILFGAAAGGRRLLTRLAPSAAVRLAPFFPLLLIAALVVAQLAILAAISTDDDRCGFDVALGDLRAKHAAGCFDPGSGVPVFVVVLALVAATFIATRAETLTTLQLVARVAAVAIALQLPTVYGYLIKRPLYRVVRVAAGGKTIDGLLMLQTNSSVQLWDAAAAHGRMRILPGSGLVESGPALDLFEVAKEIAANPDPNAFQLLCKRHLPPGGP